MSSPLTKTIDNLGIEPHIQYDQKRTFLEPSFIEETQAVGSQLSKDILTPFVYLQGELLFGIQKSKTPFSIISAPAGYGVQPKTIFISQQLARNLGPEEYINALIGRIEGRRDEEKKKGLQDKELFQKESTFKTVDRESSKIMEMMQDINKFNKMIEEINAKRYSSVKG